MSVLFAILFRTGIHDFPLTENQVLWIIVACLSILCIFDGFRQNLTAGDVARFLAMESQDEDEANRIRAEQEANSDPGAHSQFPEPHVHHKHDKERRDRTYGDDPGRMRPRQAYLLANGGQTDGHPRAEIVSLSTSTN